MMMTRPTTSSSSSSCKSSRIIILLVLFSFLLEMNDAFLIQSPPSIVKGGGIMIQQQRNHNNIINNIHPLGVTNLPNGPTTIQTEISKDDDDDDDKEKEMNPSSSSTTTTTATTTTTSKKRKSSSSGLAIVLNTNARGVTSDLITSIQSQFELSNKVKIYITSTKEEAEIAVQEILSLPSSTTTNVLPPPPAKIVVPVGGDGTLTTMIQMFKDATSSTTNTDTSTTTKVELPLFGYIPMGTGNALGTVIGCTPKRRFRKNKKMDSIQDVLHQLLDIAQRLEREDDNDEIENDNDENEQQQQQEEEEEEEYKEREYVDIVDIPLLQITTTTTTTTSSAEQQQQQKQQQKVCCFFAGIGFDSLMLQDYKDLQEWSSKSTIWKNKFQSVWGYTVALFTRTLPKCITNQSHLVDIELYSGGGGCCDDDDNDDDESTTSTTLWVDHRRGDVLRKIPSSTSSKKKTLLYKGQAGIVAVSTTPYYGGNLKLFPFARLTENGCQVRIGRIHPLNGVLNIPKIFSGSYRNNNMGCLDFIGTQFTLDIISPTTGYPVQHSGESIGQSKHVTIQVLNEPVRFVTLLPPRLVIS